MTKWQIFVEYVLKNKVIWLLCFANIFPLCGAYWYRPVVNRVCVRELKLSKAVAIQGFTLFEAGALVGTLLWGWLSDGERSPWHGGLYRAGADYRHARCVSTRQQRIYLRLLSLRWVSGLWPAIVDWRGGCWLCT